MGAIAKRVGMVSDPMVKGENKYGKVSFPSMNILPVGLFNSPLSLTEQDSRPAKQNV